MEACASLLEPCERSLGWTVAPTHDLASRVLVRVVDAMKEYFRHRVREVDLRNQRIVVQNLGGGLSELRGKSADMPVTLLGEGLDWLIVDEAVRLKAEIWTQYLAPRLVDRHGWALLLSTPGGCDWFYELYKRGQRGRDAGFESWCSPSAANPHLDQVVIEEECARLAPDVFAQEYGAVFLGSEREPCEVCHGPSEGAPGVVVIWAGEELLRCAACGEGVDAEGKTLVKRPPGREAYLVVLREGQDAKEEVGLAHTKGSR